MPTFETIAEGLCFPEGPRWHEGALWFSDMHGHTVNRLARDGTVTAVAEVSQCPSGLGFLPDGTPLVVSMHDRRVLRIADGATELHADLSQLAPHDCNDMVVDAHGRAYVGNFGGPEPPPAPAVPTVIVMVMPGGQSRVVADHLLFPNGMAITADGRSLIVAESRSVPSRLTTFTIGDDGSLSDRRVLIEFGEHDLADGVCLDDEGLIWVAMPFADRITRVTPRGEVDRDIEIDRPYAVATGGVDGRELFVCTAPAWEPDAAVALRGGKILRATL